MSDVEKMENMMSQPFPRILIFIIDELQEENKALKDKVFGLLQELGETKSDKDELSNALTFYATTKKNRDWVVRGDNEGAFARHVLKAQKERGHDSKRNKKTDSL